MLVFRWTSSVRAATLAEPRPCASQACQGHDLSAHARRDAESEDGSKAQAVRTMRREHTALEQECRSNADVRALGFVASNPVS